jgi:hypothetical protein
MGLKGKTDMQDDNIQPDPAPAKDDENPRSYMPEGRGLHTIQPSAEFTQEMQAQQAPVAQAVKPAEPDASAESNQPEPPILPQ